MSAIIMMPEKISFVKLARIRSSVDFNKKQKTDCTMDSPVLYLKTN